MANDSVVTQNTLQTFYDNKVYPYLNGATHTGCVPLGTVLPYYGETAPEHFLICDGTEYLKSDYGELATHLLSLTDPTPYQGSDADHFKVPDLRGEFLRGSGTNSHSGQGSGGVVGEHQNATEHMNMDFNSSNNIMHIQINNTSYYQHHNNEDTLINQGAQEAYTTLSKGTSSSKTHYTSRPTNTSVTYIIAYQNAYIDLALDGFPIDITQPQDGQLLMYDATAGRWVNGGHKYSTDEHIVGTWIDGKPIYRKTYYMSSMPNSSFVNVAHNISNIDTITNLWGVMINRDGTTVNFNFTGTPALYGNGSTLCIRANTTNIVIGTTANWTNSIAYVHIEYTKTTD